MTPEIHVVGARQFQHDVRAFERLFQPGGQAAIEDASEPQHGPMERAAAASWLMSLDSSQIQAMREAFNALVVPTSSIGSLFGRRGDEASGGLDINHEAVNRLSADDFYRDERLMEEAANMLEAKDFGALSLDEAFSIINRRA
ncbi:hypothetical protein ACHAWF_017205 [Thalassiosira exigua]